jgi:hypothetical protein
MDAMKTAAGAITKSEEKAAGGAACFSMSTNSEIE